ncbi:hypothetical protein [Aquibium oceanicum]|uniref:Uncharacterized protein n=1 Tax=Aquibium oceanicum TaxID=1670800 RepID=A0A1L3SU97_9HYPH|nr:hypothetical protein [Aquibium oceanicum]APH73013.1 hypothetical protein BSQ44_17800 [Aquibium oceanicum]
MSENRRLSRRISVRNRQGVTTVSIKPAGGIGAVVVPVFFLVFWSFGGLLAVMLLMVERDKGQSGAFFVMWLVAWVIGVAFALINILWKLFGRTVLVITPAAVSVSRKILGLGGTTRLPIDAMGDMHWVSDDPGITVKVNGKRIPQSALKIRTGSGQVSVARRISRDDAEAIIAACGPEIPRWGRAAA